MLNGWPEARTAHGVCAVPGPTQACWGTGPPARAPGGTLVLFSFHNQVGSGLAL